MPTEYLRHFPKPHTVYWDLGSYFVEQGGTNTVDGEKNQGRTCSIGVFEKCGDDSSPQQVS